MTGSDFVECTTYSVRLRHWALKSRPPTTLCGNPVGDPVPASVIAALDPCGNCDKSKARREAGRSSSASK